jgi:cell division transport system permease protein
MSFASVSIIVACLIIMGSFTLLTLNVKSMIEKWESQNQMLAFVDETLSDDQAKALASDIKAVPNVSEVVFVSKDEALKTYLSQFGENDLFKGIDSSVLRHRYIIYLKDISLMSKTRDQLKLVKGIANVSAHLEISQGFVTISRIVSTVSIIVIAILLLISIFIMSNTIKLTTFDRREEIAIMKMVGATNSFIRWPFVFEGLILGFVGALVAFLLQWVIYRVMVIEIARNSTMKLIETVPFGELAIPLLLIFLGTGFIVGIGGSLTVIRKYLQV